MKKYKRGKESSNKKRYNHLILVLIILALILIVVFVINFLKGEVRLAPFTPPVIPIAYQSRIIETISGAWNLRIFENIHTAGIQLSAGSGAELTVNISRSKVFYKETTSGTWIEAHPFTDRINKSYDLYITSLFYLKPGTNYDVRVDLNNNAGSLVRQITGSFNTEPDDLTFIPTRTVSVDASGGGDFTSIQAAINDANTVPGTRIIVKSGVYNEKVTVSKSGSTDNWIQIIGEPGAILDGHDSALENMGQGQWQPYTNPSAVNCESNRCWTLSGFTENIFSIWRENKYFYRYVDADGSRTGWVNFINDASGQADQCDDIPYNDPGYPYHLEEGYFYNSTTDTIYLRLRPGDSPNNHFYFVSKFDRGFDLGDSNWIWIENMTIRYFGDAASFTYAVYMNNSNNNIIRDNKMEKNTGGVIIYWTDDNNNDLADEGGAFNRIEYNNISTFMPEHWGYCETKKGGAFIGVSMRGSVGNIIRHNYVYRTGENSIQLQSRTAQGINCDDNGCDKLYYFVGFETDVYSNFILNNVEGIEPDGPNVNDRIFDNYLKDMRSYVISLQPGDFGPHWVVRNVYYNNTRIPGEGSEGFLKIRTPTIHKYLYIYHNDYLHKRSLSGSDATFNIRQKYRDVKVRNNIFTTPGEAVAQFRCNEQIEPYVKTDLDYNNYDTSNINFINFEDPNPQQGSDDCPDVLYSSISSLCSAENVECGGRFGSAGFSAEADDYSLSSGSGNKDIALLIPGINNNYEGIGPDIGALESGNSLSCDNNGICEPLMGESTGNCPADCSMAGGGCLLQDSSLKLYIPFNNINDVTDHSGNGNNGSVNGATWTALGRYAGAYDFDGINDYINVSDSPSLDGFSKMTISMWVNLDSLVDGTVRALISKRGRFNAENSYAAGFNFGAAAPCANELDFEISANGISNNVNCIDKEIISWIGQWHHAAFVFDSADIQNARIFIDGVERTLLQQTDIDAFLYNSLNNLIIGAVNENLLTGFLDGRIDEVFVFNRDLTRQEINDIMNNNLCKAGNILRSVNFATNLGNIILNPASTRNVVFNFSIEDSNGVGDILNNSAKARFTMAGEPDRFNNSCDLIFSSVNKKNFECTVGVQFYDRAGIWNININVSNSSNSIFVNNSQTLNVELLTDISISPIAINFDNVNPGQGNNLPNNHPSIVTNNGNDEKTIKITAYNLHGVSDNTKFIEASLFRVHDASNVCSAGTFLANSSAVEITGSFLTRGASATENIYYCLTNVPSVPNQEYSTGAVGLKWIISI